MQQAAALPRGSPQECNPAQRTAAGAAWARRAGLAPKCTHTVHTRIHMITDTHMCPLLLEWDPKKLFVPNLLFALPQEPCGHCRIRPKIYETGKILNLDEKGTRKLL